MQCRYSRQLIDDITNEKFNEFICSNSRKRCLTCPSSGQLPCELPNIIDPDFKQFFDNLNRSLPNYEY